MGICGPPAPDEIADWPRLVGEIEQAFRETPYVVTQTRGGLRIEADTQDPRFLDAPRRSPFAWAPRMSLSPRTASSVIFDAGRIPAGLISEADRRDVGNAVDGGAEPSRYRFRTSEVTGPARVAARAAGFRLVRPPHVQMPIVMAGLGIVVAVGIGLALAILGITGNLS